MKIMGLLLLGLISTTSFADAGPDEMLACFHSISKYGQSPLSTHQWRDTTNWKTSTLTFFGTHGGKKGLFILRNTQQMSWFAPLPARPFTEFAELEFFYLKWNEGKDHDRFAALRVVDKQRAGSLVIDDAVASDNVKPSLPWLTPAEKATVAQSNHFTNLVPNALKQKDAEVSKTLRTALLHHLKSMPAFYKREGGNSSRNRRSLAPCLDITDDEIKKEAALVEKALPIGPPEDVMPGGPPRDDDYSDIFRRAADRNTKIPPGPPAQMNPPLPQNQEKKERPDEPPFNPMPQPVPPQFPPIGGDATHT